MQNFEGIIYDTHSKHRLIAIEEKSSMFQLNKTDIKTVHGFEFETLNSKLENHLRLSPEERFYQALNMMMFLTKLNPQKVSPDDYKSIRTIQIIKSA